MMTQSQALSIDEQAIAQLELEQYIARQSNSTAPSLGAKYAVPSANRSFLPDADAQNVPILSQGSSRSRAKPGTT